MPVFPRRGSDALSTLAFGFLVLTAATGRGQTPTIGPAKVPPAQTQPLIGPAPPDVLKAAAARPWLDPPAQLPPLTPPSKQPPQSTAEVPVPPVPQRFDTGSLRLKRDQGQWQLWAGNLLLKDFGPSEADAHKALQVFRDLRVNSRGSVGGVFEYWLTEGQAPSAITRHRQVIPFDPASLRIEQISGQWVLRDAHVILYNFGTSKLDAQQALAVCGQYGFNQLGYIGHPVPALKYLMMDPRPRSAPTGPAPVLPVTARMQAAEAAHSRLVLPTVGDIGERVPFDARGLDLRREGGEWVLYAGRASFGRFGLYEREGRVRHWRRCNSSASPKCAGSATLGSPFSWPTDRAPQGTTIGLAARPLRPEQLNVRQVGGVWAVCEGQRPVFQFGDKADDAQNILAAIREYHFDHVIAIGNGRTGNMHLFVKTRY